MWPYGCPLTRSSTEVENWSFNWQKYLISVLNGIACCRGKRRQKDLPPSPPRSEAGVENGGMTKDREIDVEMEDLQEKKQRHSSAATIITVNEEAENQETWKQIARALDRIFFWLFLTLFVVSSVVIYAQAGRLATFDKFWTLQGTVTVPRVSFSYRKVTGLLNRYFERNRWKVPSFCFVGVAPS